MWGFLKKRSSKKVQDDKKTVGFNWCLFLSNSNSMGSGVFFSSLGPGIKDCKKGILYIIPGDYMLGVNYKTLTAEMAKYIILEYYGVNNCGLSTMGPKETIWLKK